jgi:Homeodomain-like domain
LSTYRHDYSGTPRAFTRRSVAELMAARKPPTAILEYLLDEGTTISAKVEEGVNHRPFALLLAASIACGIDFGIYRSRGPAEVFYISGSHFESDWQRLKSLQTHAELAQARARLESNLTFYHREHEADPLVDLGHPATQEAMRKSMPDRVSVVVVDWVPSFMRQKLGKLQPISPVKWFSELNAEGIAVVAFDVLRPGDYPPASEAQAASTAYLSRDENAPSHLGSGFTLERWRAGDPDFAPRRSSFWHTELGGELEYGFSLPDPSNTDAPEEIRKSERFIKLELLLAEGMPLKDIATEFGVHKSTITRMKQRIQEDARQAKAEAARDPNGPVNSWKANLHGAIPTPVKTWPPGPQLGKRLQAIRRNGDEEEGKDDPDANQSDLPEEM